MTNDETPLEIRPKLLEAMLPHVAFDGWTKKTMSLAADDLGISPEIAELAYPQGPIEVLQDHLKQADEQLLVAIQALPLNEMKIRDKITQAIKLRLQGAHADKDIVRKGVALLALPQYAPIGMKALWDTSDLMWRAIGDTSTDHNWYTKRMTLSAVYSAVLTYWLNDETENNDGTWEFLDRRIEDVMKIETTKFQIKEVTKNMPSLSKFFGRLRYPNAS
ncbi:COQ9 family protein [Temperatibacter marinus]|uniref:COQ9 family protein n=1 Tax=Temperatibacter marinus TaxID=1456591 RepID=A0AA52EG14_9PROT|nr:COQ9 family protein [Temperatibacter marinus]WND01649.1 COQ9 family protein [Temperatibacter marinus]